MADDAKTRELADGVVQVFLPLPFKPTIINVYLVRAGSTWTLIDTGMHTGDSRRAFVAAGSAARHPRRKTTIVCSPCWKGECLPLSGRGEVCPAWWPDALV